MQQSPRLRCVCLRRRAPRSVDKRLEHFRTLSFAATTLAKPRDTLLAGTDATTPEWAHETVIRGGSPRAMARAFVCTTLGLGGHGLFHLVDLVQLVACELAANKTRRAAPVTMRMSKTGDVVRLEVHEAPSLTPAPVMSGPAGEAWHGSRFIELLSLQWGSTSAAETTILWVTFDARPTRHATHTARRASDLSHGHVPGVGGTHDLE